ncbi:non-ribosomal peptide synthetase/type I polyketide synthase [Labedaea rhizosphaerae]|uniref:Phenyloxazoline synthase MbtB n=1 Tax=Labedaea rhizosphaerae TaxID=598644 RepID=A0A4R6S0I8_LABRH|nr:non-ribosomal peptide synthetase/type I polyketide synthase [Labedaea rhizosphaerae]TDP93019.1 non-ribosomal peptide synthase protein (TIGR01720 family)/amino acid adenylation domain-containing protein [Labedaea rhizosphaerae]
MTDLAARLASLTDSQRKLLAAKLGLTAEPAPAAEPVAVVGMGCRLPGGIDSPQNFWDALCAGRDLIGEVPPERWSADEWYDADPAAPGVANSRWGGFLDDVAGFDRRYFGIPADEAERMDPQQRLLLETAFAALADAGIPAASLAGTDTGVFMASMTDDYTWLQAADPAAVTVHTGTGTQRSILANRLSYELDVHGPSVALDTACSSSLVAIHLACQSIRTGEAEVALAGGVNVMASPVTTVIYAKLGMLAADGRCKTFDARADGFVRGEGAGVVVLKRLSAAQRDADPIWAVIRGSAIGQDGRTSGITAPSGPAQTALITRALRQAGVAPEHVRLVETHGTGTPLGDPLELEALAAALTGADSCRLGAVKTNAGHLEAAAGVVGLIKTALSLHHRIAPPVLHQQRRNPRIALDVTPFAIPVVPTPLPGGDDCFAGVSSFGFGGALAHAVLGPAPATPAVPQASGPQLITVSGRSAQAAKDLAAAYAEQLDGGDVAVADLAFTSVRRRDHHPHRIAVVAETAAEAATALRAAAPRRAAEDPAVAFVFPGQGAVEAGTAAELHRESEAFRAAVAACDEQFRRRSGFSPVTALFETEQFGDGSFDPADTRQSQAVQFTLHIGLAAHWAALGVTPAVVFGQSLGEVAAAHVAGALDLADAVAVVVARSELMARVQGKGASAVVELAEADVDRLGLAVAGVLSPTTTLVAGSVDDVRQALDRLAADGVFTHELRDARMAFHSPELAALAPELAAALRDIRPRPPRVPLISTVTGGPIDTADAAYWARNLAEPFRLPVALDDVAGRGVGCVVEVSAHPALRRAIGAVLPVTGSLTRGEPDRRAVLTSAAVLLTHGVELDLAALAPAGRVVRLPGYPWQHEEAWLPPRPVRRSGTAVVIPQPRERLEPPPEREREPEPEAVEDTDEFTDDVERLLHRLWTDVLVVEPELVRPDTNFFDLGGNSLKGFWLVRQISEALDVRIPMDRVADLLTIRDLAAYIRAADPERAPQVEPGTGDDGAPAADDARHEPFPLLPLQRAYWVGQSLELGGVAAKHYLEYELDGVDLDRLEAGWNRLVRRHEMLRAVIDADGTQRILATVPDYEFGRTDLSTSDDVQAELEALRARLTEPARGQDEWPLFEIHATTLPGGATRVHLSMDMMSCDGRSFAIISDEWRRLQADPAADLPPLTMSFRDFVLRHWADEEGANEDGAHEDDRAAEYWRPRLAELPPPPALPWAADPAELGKPEFRRRSARIGKDRWRALRTAAGKAGIGPSALLLAAFAEVLGTWSAQPRFCVNVTTFTLRTTHPAAADVVGDFTSNVPVAVDALAAPTLRERARLVQQRLWSDVEHVGRGGVALLAEANALRGDDAFRLGVPYVFTSLLAGDEDDDALVPFGWLGRRAHSVALTPQVLVDLQVMQDRGDLVLDFDTVDAMFSPGVVDAVFDALVGLVGALADDAATWELAPQSLVPDADLEARAAANRTDAPVPGGGLHEPFVRQAREHPERIAVRSSARTLTYGEVDAASEHVAQQLTEHGVEPGALVAVSMRKGWDQVVAVLGVLKAGAAYVPVDPDLPPERRQELLRRTNAAAVLTQPFGTVQGIDGVDGIVVDGTGAEPVDRPRPAGDDLAYVIFTSGSTGAPKGVAVHHRAAVNTVLDINSRFGVRPGDAVLALSSLSFDLSVYDVFGVLAAGATIVLPDADRAQDPAHWADLVTEHRVTLWNSVPALYGMFVDHLSGHDGSAPALRSVLLSGDWIPLTLPERSRAVLPDTELTSLGGATEAAIWSIHHPIGDVDPAWRSIPYGTPLANQRFHVYNAAGAPCPTWVPGELRIAGVGVAKGYHDDPERTAASFPVDERTGERHYRTGDLGRYRPDGTIEFLGRDDLQVKVQGHRIELGEVEAALRTMPGVTDAAVVVLGPRDGNRTLAAHAVGAGLTASAVRAHLAARLPGYMVPPTVTFWPALPLTGNGKVDRKRLAAAGHQSVESTASDDSTVDESGFVAPATPVQRALAEIWASVLGVERIGLHDRFFEFGGDSVLGIQVVSRAARAGLGLRPRDLFEHQTIAELAHVVRVVEQIAGPVELTGSVPLTPIQRWMLGLELADPAHFGQSLLLAPAAGPLDGTRLGAALGAVADRHDVLRLRWRRDGESWTQEYADRPGVAVERVHLDADTLDQIVADREAAMDLAEGPVLRAVLFETPAGCERLLLTCHHLAVDGVSWQVLLDDLAAAYDGLPLPPVTATFGEYAEALAARAPRPGSVQAWRDRLAVPTVPVAEPAGVEGEAHTATRALQPDETTALLTTAGAAYRTTIDELLLTALAATLDRGPVRVDLERHGRDVPGIPDVTGTVGWFTTILPTTPDLSDVDVEAEPGRALAAVKEHVRAAPPDAELLHDRLPRADVVLNYLGRLDGLDGDLLRLADGRAGRSRGPRNRRPWPVEVDCRVLGGRFELTVTHDSAVAARALADGLLAAIRLLLRHCADPAAGGYTPSDFPLADLTDETLALVLRQFRAGQMRAAQVSEEKK